MTKAYVFYDDERCIPYKDERVVLPQRLSQYNFYYLAIFMPNQPNTKDFEESIQYALKNNKIFVNGCEAHASRYDFCYYAGFDNFDLDSLRHLIAKHLLEQLDAEHSDTMIKTLSEGVRNNYSLPDCFKHFTDLQHLESRTFKQGDTQDLSVTKIFVKMTAMADVRSCMADMPSVIVVKGYHADNVYSMLGKKWKYDDVKYRCVMNDDKTIVYEIENYKVNNG